MYVHKRLTKMYVTADVTERDPIPGGCPPSTMPFLGPETALPAKIASAGEAEVIARKIVPPAASQDAFTIYQPLT